MRTIVLSFDNTADAQVMQNYLLSVNASPKIKLVKLELLDITILKVKTKSSEREFKNLYNI